MKNATYFLLFLFTSTLFSQTEPEKIDFMKFVQELLVTKKDKQNMKQMWLLPKEYWAAALNDSPLAGKDELIAEFTNVLEDYFIIGCLDVDIGSFGTMNSTSKTISVVANDGTIYKPILEDEQEADIKNLTSIMKPMISNMLGELGKKYDFYVFPNKNNKGENILTPSKKGEIKVILNDEDFIYKTPFSALVSAKKCTVDNEEVNGNWSYCPWHGDTLEVK